MKEGARSRVCRTLAIAYDLVRVPLKKKTSKLTKKEEVSMKEEGEVRILKRQLAPQFTPYQICVELTF